MKSRPPGESKRLTMGRAGRSLGPLMKPKVLGLGAGVLGVLALVGVGAALRDGTLMRAGAMCGFGHETVTAEAKPRKAQRKSPDLLMSVMCERACAAKVEYRDDQVVSQPGARPGDLTRCPVSGVVFLVQQENSRHSQRGRTWFTCCETCTAKLRKNPERFLTL
jgi:YHS domain-containing protein